MSYTNRNSSQTKSGTLIAVAALHVAAAYALINGLGIDYIKENIVSLPTQNYESPPPDPVPVPQPPKTEPKDRVVDAVRPKYAEPTDRTFIVDMPLTIPRTQDLVIVPKEIEIPKPAPSFQPVGAAPKTSPGGWVSANDYPTRDIRQGNEGTAVLRLSIDTSGTVRGCEITRSSGHAGLDQATCTKVSQRARFDPARDDTGQRVASNYTGSIRWVIPH